LTLMLAAYADEPFDIQSQIGPNPVLPDIQQYLFRQCISRRRLAEKR